MELLRLASELLGLIDFDKSKVVTPRKLVFLCGGKQSGLASAPHSLRERMLQHSKLVAPMFSDATVLLAEEAANALATSSFQNLLVLEEYIAAIVDALVLVVESPGSFCELGAFVTSNEISEKLIVVLQSEYMEVPSFITNGAIKYLKDKHPQCSILGFHWTVDNTNGVVSVPDYALTEMTNSIPKAMDELQSARKKERFDGSKLGHTIILTLAFCHLLRAAKAADVKACFQAANVKLGDAEIARCLDTLVICSLLKAVQNGKSKYYISQVQKLPLDASWKTSAGASDRRMAAWIARIAQALKIEDASRFQLFEGHRSA